jgi:hypothetical protein
MNDHMMFSRSVQELLGAMDRLSCIHSCPEAREGTRERAIYYTTVVLLWPLRNMLKDRHWEEHNLRDVYIRTTPEPKTLAQQKRERRMSLEKIETVQLSRLLDLPREVRDVIWECAAGKMQVHWWIEKRKLRGMVCRSEEENCQSRCMYWIQKKGADPWPVIGVMGMLVSCRQM